MVQTKSKTLILISECFSVAAIMILLQVHAFGQGTKQIVTSVKINNPTIKPLAVGDKLPDNIILTNIFNHSSNSINLSNLKGKITILDFWATWCGSCIESIPKLQKLKEEFKDHIEVILINSWTEDTREKVKGFFEAKEIRTGEKLMLPTILQDSVLTSYFPHKAIPHYILLDKSNTVLAITSGEEINESNIQAIVDGKKLDFYLKNDSLEYNPLRNLFSSNDSLIQKSAYRSIFTGYKKDLGSALGRIPEKNDKFSKLYVINYPLVSLIKIAYSNIFRYPLNRTILDIEDSSKLLKILPPTSAKDKYSNYYCYEVITPPVSAKQITTYLQDDIRRSFGLIAKNEMRTINCYALKIKNKHLVQKLLTKGGPVEEDIDKNSLFKHLKNKPFSSLVEILNSLLKYPLIDKSNLTVKVDIELPYNIYNFNIKLLNEFLTKNGLILEEYKNTLEVAVITDKLD